MVLVDEIGIEAELALRHHRDARLSFIMAGLTLAIVACESGLTTEVETRAATNLDRARRAFDAATVAANKVEMSEVERKWFMRRHSLARTRLRELAEQLFRLAAGMAKPN